MSGEILYIIYDLAKKCRMYANHGALKKHTHQIEGINSRLDGIQAAILRAKLPNIIEWTEMRRQNAMSYTNKLLNVSQIELPEIRLNTKHSFHLYVIKAEKRDELAEFLKKNEIVVAIHYPVPLPFMEAYQYLKPNYNDYEVVASNKDKILSIPIFPELTEQQIEYVVSKIKFFYKKC